MGSLSSGSCPVGTVCRGEPAEGSHEGQPSLVRPPRGRVPSRSTMTLFLAVALGGAGAGLWPLPLCPVSPRVRLSVCLSVPHMPVLCCAHLFISLMCGSQNLSREKARRRREGRRRGGRGTPGERGGGPAALLRPDRLPGFCPSSAQHRGGRFLGGDREGPHGLVSGRLRGGGADETV